MRPIPGQARVRRLSLSRVETACVAGIASIGLGPRAGE